MLTDIRNALDRKKNENGSAMIFAILVLMILLLATVIVSTYATTAAVTARELTSRDALRNAANAAIENAMLTANNNSNAAALEAHRGVGNSVTGTYTSDSSNQGTDLKWTWYTERVVLSGQRVGYYVYATGYNDKQGGKNAGVRFRAQFDPISVTGGKWNPANPNGEDGRPKTDKGSVSYNISSESPYQLGLTGLSSLSIEGNAKIYSSDSFYGNQPSGTSSNKTTAATNGTMNITAPTSGLQQKSFTAPVAGEEPCTSAGCATSGTTYRNYDINMDDVATVVNGGKLSGGTTVAGKCANVKPIWKASENAGIMNIANDSCVQQIIFDVNTNIPATYSINSPLKLYTTTGVTVYKGVKVNTTNSPASLRIYSATGGVNVGDSTNTYLNGPTYLGAYIATAQGRCQVYSGATYFGALACANTNIYSGSIFYQDLASFSVNTNVSQRNVWSQGYLEEL